MDYLALSFFLLSLILSNIGSYLLGFDRGHVKGTTDILDGLDEYKQTLNKLCNDKENHK